MMGTRADFYVGRGRDAEWIGSVAWDGSPDGFDTAFYAATTEGEFRRLMAEVAEERDDWIAPERGWPWPWDTSSTTDYAYAFDGGRVYATYSEHWWEVKADHSYFGDVIGALEDEYEYGSEKFREAVAATESQMRRTTFPNMAERAMSTPDMLAASGLIVVSNPTEVSR